MDTAVWLRVIDSIQGLSAICKVHTNQNLATQLLQRLSEIFPRAPTLIETVSVASAKQSTPSQILLFSFDDILT
jgi:hypothetical protein